MSLSTSDTEEDACPTPTHTSISESDAIDEPLPGFKPITLRHSPFTFTPTSTPKAPPKLPSTPPWQDSTYIIRDPATHLVITLKKGFLGLHPEEDPQHPSPSDDDPSSPNSSLRSRSTSTSTTSTTIDGADSPHGHNRGTHWHCVENKNRWLGFYNAVSGTYIRHNNQKKEWRFDANGKKHGDWESFCARECPGGGHVLLVKHWDGLLAMRAEGGELVVDCKGEGGTAWEFVRVG